MDSTRWRHIDEVFAAAVEQPADRRSAFLDEACGEDAELRREVESLLAHHRDDGILERPGAEWEAERVGESEPETLVGHRLGRFEVLAKLGAGGMGEVYVARDPTLERRVAIKFLPPHLADDPERIRRFRREAIAASALNHPNILTVYEVVGVAGRELLVSELVEGVTLRQRLRQGPLPVPAALDVAAQAARGLAAAHGAGIVHRDVKPENLMIRDDGLVKLLDFGIAKSPPPSAEGRDLSHVLTGAGLILGTASYMSPEQARGEPAGPQVDIWALGCVLYESLTGRQAFAGRTVTDVLAAILTREPDWEALPAETPLPARRLLRRCLQKSPDQRLHAVADARLELEDAAREPEGVIAATSGVRRGSWLPWAVAALAAAVAIGLAVVSWRQPAAAPAVAFELPSPADGGFLHSVESATLALSPDGSLVGFIGRGSSEPPTGIWVRPLAELTGRLLPGTEGASSLFWSPDGASVGFVADGKLKRVPVAGGAPVVLCDVEKESGVSGTWGRDSILFASVQGPAIFRVPVGGGTPTVVLEVVDQGDERRVVWPWFLPDGERFLYLSFRADGSSELKLAGDGEPKSVAPMTSRVELVDPGFAVFAREGALLAQRFDADRAALVGAPVPLAPAVRTFASTGAASFATARRGTVAVATQQDLHRITLVDRDGQELRAIGEALTANSVAMSPDGRRAIVDRLRPGLATYDLWMFDLERGVESQLTDGPGTEVYAMWLPDGRGIVYSRTLGSVPTLLRRDLASGTEEAIVPPGPFQIAVGVTPDGRRLLYQQRETNGFPLLVAPLDGPGAPVPVLRPGVSDLQDPGRWPWAAALSPDGRVVAYTAGERRPELFVRLLDGGETLRVSVAGAWRMRFSRDGETLYYLTPDRRLVAVPVATAPHLVVGAPDVRFELPVLGWRDFDVLPDGGFLALVRETDGSQAPLTVITGWNEAGRTD